MLKKESNFLTCLLHFKVGIIIKTQLIVEIKEVINVTPAMHALVHSFQNWQLSVEIVFHQ